MAYTVYGFTGSTYVRTVRMILAEKSVPYWWEAMQARRSFQETPFQ